MSAPDFWDDRDKAQALSSEASREKEKLARATDLASRVADFDVLIEMAKEEDDPNALAEVSAEFKLISQTLRDFELEMLLSGEHDRAGALLSINAGAGGTEACDWADMLLRLYRRWIERKGFKAEMLDYQPGEEAGVRSVTLQVAGEFAYGYLKCERGVHRLVRISPFDSAGKRHTSFASIEVTPDLGDDEINIEINEADLDITTTRSGGKGGQNVNKVETAVLMRHLPSGVFVRCSVERSQHKNRDRALQILKAKLYQIEEDKKRASMEKEYGERAEIGFGSQIRSYVFQPYQMVKDLRTGHQSGNIQAIMDGEIDGFIESMLRGERRGESDPDEV
jgi:peptide chain release factor 2